MSMHCGAECVGARTRSINSAVATNEFGSWVSLTSRIAPHYRPSVHQRHRQGEVSEMHVRP